MQKTKFKIKGLKCDNCSLLIEEKFKNKEGIIKIKVDQNSSKGIVVYDSQKITEQDIYQAVESINDFKLEKIEEITNEENKRHDPDIDEYDLVIKKAKFRIKGLKCGNCAILIEEKLKNKPGVVKIRVDSGSGKGVVVYDGKETNEKDIYAVIEEISDFEVEDVEDTARNSEAKINYKNPDSLREAKPPIKFSLVHKSFAAAAVLVLIFLSFALGAKNNQRSQVSGTVQNTPQKQQNQQPLAQQPQPSKNIVKSDKPVLEAYVVSKCPYGLQMQRVLADIVKNIPSLEQNIEVKYIGAVSNGKITAMHGDAEAEENLRQICIREEQPDKYFKYISCHIKKGDTSACEAEAGIAEKKLSACVSDANKGISYAEKDFELDRKYQIRGSPTLVLNGQQISEASFGGRNSDGIKNAICSAFNSQPEFCSKKLTTANAAAGFSSSY